MFGRSGTFSQVTDSVFAGEQVWCVLRERVTVTKVSPAGVFHGV